MTFSLYSEDGVVTGVGTITGYAKAVQFIKSLNVDGPLNDFIKEGQTQDIKGVIRDLDGVILFTSDTDTRSVLSSLKKGLKSIQDKEVAIIAE